MVLSCLCYDLNSQCATCLKHQLWAVTTVWSEIFFGTLPWLIVPMLTAGLGFVLGSIADDDTIVTFFISVGIGICFIGGLITGLKRLFRKRNDLKKVVSKEKPMITLPELSKANIEVKNIS
jgi:hypothetical protein